MKKIIAILGIATVDGLAAATYAALVYPMTLGTIVLANRIWQSTKN